MQQVATDPKTGQIDMDIINTGTSQANTERIKKIAELISNVNKDFHDKIGQGVKFYNLLEFISQKAQEGKLGHSDEERKVTET